MILAKTSQPTITFPTSSSAQGPIANNNYIASGLNLQNQVAKTGTSTTISFTIRMTTATGRPFNTSSAIVQVSTNDGVTWAHTELNNDVGLITANAVIPTTGTTTYVSILVTTQ